VDVADTEAELGRGRIVAFRETGDFDVELERKAARLGVSLSNVCWIRIRSGRIPTLDNERLHRGE
jgi:hypothetical protein